MGEYHHRKYIRLYGYDYTTAADYFVTVCCQDRLQMFGEIIDEKMNMNEAGRMVADAIEEISQRYSDVDILQSVVMPNHIHILIGKYNEHVNLTDIMRWLKSVTTNRYIHGVREKGWKTFPGTLWQRNYYEHIVRNQRAFDYISKYIYENPVRWFYDKMNEQCKQSDEIMKNILQLEAGDALPTVGAYPRVRS